MEDKNCELLFEYLRSILYDKEIQTLDITKLDEPYQKLGRGLQVLERTVEEMLEASKEDFTMSFSYGVVEYDSREEGINRKVRMKTCIG